MGSDEQSAECAQYDEYRYALTMQYGEAARDTEADKVSKQRKSSNKRSQILGELRGD